MAQDRKANLPDYIDQATLDALPADARKAVDDAVMLFEFLRKREGTNLAPAFAALLGSLDAAAKVLSAMRYEFGGHVEKAAGG